MIRGRRQALCLFVLLCVPFSVPERVHPQETAAPEPVPEPAGYVIRGIEYDIDGRTQDWALAHATELRLDESFPSRESFNAYLERKRQALYNQRTLEETSLEYRFGEMEAGGLVPVYLTVKAKDSWNLIIFPEPKYDSNNAGSAPFPSGFSLTIKARDFNFWGTMTPLKFDAGYLQKEGKDYGTFLLDMGLPFQALGFHWFLDFDNELVFSPGEALSYRNTVGLSVDIPLERSDVAVGFNQRFIVNEEDEDDPVSLYFEDTWYLSSELYGVWKLPFGIDTGYGELYYAPELSLLANYRPGGDIGEYRSGPSLTPGHSLGFERVDWRGNFREGAAVLLRNTNEYNTSHQTWERRFSVSVAIHRPLTGRFGVSARFMAQFWPDEPYKFAGDVLRGEKDNYLMAEKLVSLNLDFPFLLYRFLPAERYNKRTLRFLEFEQHWAAFFDFGLFEGTYRREAGKDGKRKRYTTEPCSWADGLIITGGLEIITFPYRWRSVYLRISLGYNLLEMIRARGGIKDEEKEIYIGLGHFY